MTTRMSDDTELFPLSALLYNREHAEDKEYWQQFGIEHVEVGETKEIIIHNDIRTDYEANDLRDLAGTVIDVPDVATMTIKVRNTSVYSVSVRYIRSDNTSVTVSVPVLGHVYISDIADTSDRVEAGIVLTKRNESYSIYTKRVSPTETKVESTCPILLSIWDRICGRVNEAYYDRFLGGETMEQWQRRLQVITDRIALRYERAFRIYADNQTRLEKEFGMSQTTEYLDVRDTSASVSENRVTDTPDTAVNEDQNYAGSIAKGDTGSENVKTGKVRTSMTSNGGLAEQLNQNLDAWRDLETDLVDEYAKAFLSLVWY